jgi:cell division protein FtsB
MQKLNALQKEIAYYKSEIYTYRQQYKELFSDKDDLEKFAREQYQMKEENEDLFIIISE